MTPQLYLEFDTNLLCARAEEGFGRCYADTESARMSVEGATQYIRDAWANPIYPVPSDTYNNAPYPDYVNGYPPPESFTWFYTQCNPKVAAGGVLPLDDFMVSMNATQTLSDGSTWSVNLGTEAKTFEQLSTAGKAAVS